MPRIRLTPSRILGAAGALAAGVLGATLAAGGSYAYLNATATVSASGGTITAGTAALLLQLGAGTPAASVTPPASQYANMLPGDIVNQVITVSNTGHAALNVTAAVSADGAWETRLVTGACPAAGTVIPGAALTTTPSTSGYIVAGASAAICVQVVLPTAAPAAGTEAGTASFVLTLDGTQATS